MLVLNVELCGSMQVAVATTVNTWAKFAVVDPEPCTASVQVGL
jgi:hypothetical protein